MSINISVPSNGESPEMKPRITVFGVGGAGGNAVNNMIQSALEGVDFVVANTDAQALALSRTDRRVQLGATITQGLGAGSRPDIGRAAAEEVMEEIIEHLRGSHMAFITAGMGGGTGTGAGPVIASAAREQGILTVGVVTKPFAFEGIHRMKIAEQGIEEMERFVDTLIIIPNQNLFRIANEKTTFADAFTMADDVLYSGVRGVTDLMIMPGLINLDFADIRAVMGEMGKAMMGTGEADGERRALDAAEAAIANPLLDDISMNGATGVLINITGGSDMTLFEVDEAANRIRSEVDPEAQIIFGSTFDEGLDGRMRVSIVATGMDALAGVRPQPTMLNVVPVSVVSAAANAGAADDAPSATGSAGDDIRTVIAMRPADDQAEAADAGDDGSDMDAAGSETESPADDKKSDVEATFGDEDVAAAMSPSDSADSTKSIPAMPSANAADSFIPPAPAGRTPALSAEPFAAAAMANGAREAGSGESTSTVTKGPSLFERVTGTGRAAKAEAADDRTADDRTAETDAAAEGGGGPVESASTAAGQGESAAQPELGSLNAEDRLAESKREEDLLDIPAFLRRQAN